MVIFFWKVVNVVASSFIGHIMDGSQLISYCHLVLKIKTVSLLFVSADQSITDAAEQAARRVLLSVKYRNKTL